MFRNSSSSPKVIPSKNVTRYSILCSFIWKIRKPRCENPRLQESQILQILSKFLSTLHFLQESYKFVQESQILQICYNVDHFLQDSDNIFCKKWIFFARNPYKKCDVLIQEFKFQKSSNYQQQQPRLPFTLHKLS